jgi:hypothetical protein
MGAKGRDRDHPSCGPGRSRQDRGPCQELRGSLRQSLCRRRARFHRRGDPAAFDPTPGGAGLRGPAQQAGPAPLQEARQHSPVRMRRGWHILRDEDGEGGGLTLCRRLPARFDVTASTQLAAGDPLRLAHQIRQDVWRALQGVRGFSPAVRLRPSDAGWSVTAGGRLDGPVPQALNARVAEVLAHRGNRARWQRHARRRATATEAPR